MKKRIIPSILLSKGTEVSLSQNFKPWRTCGTLAQNLKLHCSRDADELLIINLGLDFKSQSFQRILNLIRKEVDIPISYVGGVDSAEVAIELINQGFDKVMCSELVIKNQTIIEQISSTLGSQSVGLVIPYYIYCGIRYLYNWREMKVSDLVLEDVLSSNIVDSCGDIVLHCVNKDGLLEGMDEEIIRILENQNIKNPIVLAGGAERKESIYKVLDNNEINGVSMASIFALTEETPSTVRKYCIEKGLKMRRV